MREESLSINELCDAAWMFVGCFMLSIFFFVSSSRHELFHLGEREIVTHVFLVALPSVSCLCLPAYNKRESIKWVIPCAICCRKMSSRFRTKK